MNIKKWTDKRSNETSADKVTLSAMFASTATEIESQYGISLSKADEYLSEPYKFAELRLSKKFNDIKSRYAYEAFFSYIAPKLVNVSEKDLAKSLPKEHVDSIKEIENQNGQKEVDHAQHVIDFASPPEYKAAIASGIKPDKESGDSFKIAFNTNKGDRFMIKPYHAKHDVHSSALFPISGWATTTTKALYNAANIGKLCEDVSVDQHDNIPVTVHKFAKDMEPLSKSESYDLNPFDVHAIGVMDYLTNNLDRHSGNLLVSKKPYPSGRKGLLAIDHDQNFQYVRNLSHMPYANDSGKSESPAAYLSSKALQTANNSAKKNFVSHAELADWWKDHSAKIKEAFIKHIPHIKEDNLRKHVHNNFMHRWDNMNKWVNRIVESGESNHEQMDNFPETKLSAYKHPKLDSAIIQKLPKSPKDAVGALYEIAGRRKSLNHRQTGAIKEAMLNKIKEMSPEESADVLVSAINNPHWNSGSINQSNISPLDIFEQFLKEPETFANNRPVYRLNHINAVEAKLESLHDNSFKEIQAKKLVKGIKQKIEDEVARGVA